MIPLRRWTVVTDRGASIIYATTSVAARRKVQRSGRNVKEVRPRGYVPPKAPIPPEDAA